MKDIMSLLCTARRFAMGGSKRLLVALVCIFSLTIAYAQDVTITGTVVDDIGEPLIGATVMVDGTKNGVPTDIDGNFSIKVPKGAKLRISYVGYKPVVVAAQDGMTVELKTDAVALGGVEVVAFGIQKKVTVTGALSSVKGEDLTRTPVSSVNNVLAGQMTGVTTVQYSGEPGSDAATVFVRGQGTWSDSSPLIQVDGVERSMSDIDPEDIENITVLKDASATAVFGVRGANGVVLITTKRGQEGKARIDVSTSFSALTPTKLVEQANSVQYAQFYNQMQLNDYEGDPASFTPLFSDAVIEKFKDGSDPIRFPSVRWTDYAMKDVTLQTKTNVNISGGTKKVRYFVSAGLFTQDGLFKEFDRDYHFGYGYNRFNYRANLDLDVTPTTTVTFNIAGNVSSADKPNIGSEGSAGVIRRMYAATPFSSPGIVDGKYVITTTDYTDGLTLPATGASGLSYMMNNGGGAITTNINKLQGDLQVLQKLDFVTKGLSAKIKGSYNNQFNVVKTRNQSHATYTPVIQPDGEILYRKSGENTKPTYSESTSRARDWYFEASLNYNRQFGPHSVGALLLYNQSKAYYPSTYSDIPTGYVGLVGRLTYDYESKYMAEFNIGYNGSENFHPDHRFGTFPAGSIGWVISNEKFWEPIAPAINFLKLRASLGLVGNDRIGGSRFMYTADPYIVDDGTLVARPNGPWHGYLFGIDNATSFIGAYESAKNNPDVGWEKALKQDYGVDIYALNSRFRVTADYYREHRTNILLRDMTAPSYIGFAVPYANLGVMDSWGWELSLNWSDQINKDWRYWVTFNLSHNQNEIKEMKEAPLNNDYQYQKGHRVGSRSQYQFFEFYEKGKTEERYKQKFGTDYPQQLITLKDGDAVYVDLDGNGIIDPNDKTRALGFTDDPAYLAGLNFGVGFKKWELSMQWTGAWDVSRVISDIFRQPFYSRESEYGGLLVYNVEHTWNPENPGQDYEFPRLSKSAGEANNYQDSQLYEKDAKYLRLKTLSLSYTWDAPYLKKVGLRSVQASLSGYNLLTFTPYLWGDPETRASATPTYPLQRTYTLSLKLNF